MSSRSNSAKSRSLMRSLSQGVSAFLTYESRCGMSPAYCEQFVYSPIVRIAKNLGWQISSEYPVGKIKGEKKNYSGDYRRVDFVLSHEEIKIGLEVKYQRPTKTTSLPSSEDKEKLIELLAVGEISAGYIMIVGRYSKKSEPKAPGVRLLFPVAAFSIGAERTSYGVKIYQVG